MRPPRAARLEVLGSAALLAAVNFILCRELFWTKYLDNFQSNEGSSVTLAAFLARHTGTRWFPFWNAGLPIENTYDPLVPGSVAFLSSVTPLSPPLALHILCGVFFCLVPVAWFWLMRRWGLSTGCALLAGLAYSLGSPSLYALWGIWGVMDSRRLLDVVYYGDIAHMAATFFLPLALFAIRRAAKTGRAGHIAGAALLCALTALSDEIGITALSLCTLLLVASLDPPEIRKGAIRAAIIGACTYLCVCRIQTPAVLAIISRNSQVLGADYRFSKLTFVGWAIVLAGAVAVGYATRRARFVVRFTALMAWTFTSIYAIYYQLGIPVLPLTHRYDLEMDLGLTALGAIGIWHLPVRLRRVAVTVFFLAAVPQTVRLRRHDLTLLRPVSVEQTVEYRAARWISQNLPGTRVLVGGDATFWFSFWTENPQMSGGHEGLAPNMVQQFVAYTIYDKDAAYSVLWTKAFGVGAVYVPGPHSPDKIHPFVRPAKFSGVLRELWREDDTVIYASATRSASLAHVIPVSAVVTKRPADGLDIGPAEDYVHALDDSSLPDASLRWEAPDKAQIDALTVAGQVVSVQVTYDKGWTARSAGKQLAVRPDALGMMVVEPAAPGPCQITLQFTGGVQRHVLLAISVAMTVGLCLCWALDARVPRGAGM